MSGALGAVYAMIPNATGGLLPATSTTRRAASCGRKIVYKVEDDNYDPAKGLEVARKLVEQDKVLALVGNLGDLDHSSAFEYLNEVGVPDLLASAGAHKYGAGPPGPPLDGANDPRLPAGRPPSLAQYISESLPGKKVAILYEDSDLRPRRPGRCDRRGSTRARQRSAGGAAL